MSAIDIAVHQADGQRFHLFGFLQFFEPRTHFRYIQLANGMPLGIHPLGRFYRSLQRGHRFGLGPDDPGGEATGHQTAGNLHQMAMALGDNQTDLGDFLFQHRVGRDRGAVQEQVDFARGNFLALAKRSCTIDHRLGRIARGRWYLVPEGLAGGFVNQQQIGKSSADVDTQSISHISIFLL